MIENKKIFITGGCGFIGSNMVKRLMDNNKIIIYDNLRRNAIKYTEILKHPNVKFIKGDVLDKKKLNKSITKDIDIVIHAAAMAGVTSYYFYPKMTIDVNILGTHNIIDVVIKKGIKTFIQFSSSEVFGAYVYRGNESDTTNIGAPGDYRWTYAISKLTGEHLCYAFSKEKKFNFIIVRPFNIFGPGQIGEGAVSLFIDKALKNEDISVTGDGNQIRAWCYIDDFINVLLRAIKHFNRGSNQIFNIGNPLNTITILELVKLIIKLTNSKSKIKLIKHRGTDIELRVPNIKKMYKYFKYMPKISLEQGLIKTIQWHKQFSPDIKEV